MTNTRLRQVLFPLLRAAFRALPLSKGQRDRLRTRWLARHGDWVPPPPKGQQDASGPRPSAQLRWRADEPAIGHVPWREGILPSPLPATLVAFYLPQFHTFPENDAWWGKGFTEWRNVTRALPQFEGHVQPRLPADLGFYDLRNPQVMRDQARLAAEYGIGAFCFYYYWFSGRTLMEDPLRQWLDDDSIDLPFCLCWANENWARRWDGRDDDILIGQQHSAEDDLAFIAHIAPYLRDRRALKVDGLPMLLVYRPHLLPDARATADRWRRWCRDNGVGEIHLAYVQGFERPDPRDIGFDAAVEFPPNMSNPSSLSARQWLLNPDFNGDVRDWRELAAEISTRPLPDYPLYPGVNPGWDNEARRSGRGRVYLHASPRGYRDWLRTTVHQRLSAVPAEQRLVFINAWNEWAEGAVLEPDARLGHAWLQATREALSPAPPPGQARACLMVLLDDPDAMAAVLTAAGDLGVQYRLFVPAALRPQNAPAEVIGHAGNALTSLLQLLQEHSSEGALLACWLDMRGNTVPQHIPTAGAIEKVLEEFTQRPSLGMMPIAAPEGTDVCSSHLRWATRLGLAQRPMPRIVRAAWLRTEALRPLLDAHLHPSELNAMDAPGALAQLLPDIVINAGYVIAAAQDQH